MNEAGEDGMSLRKIAAKCGVSNAAPYAHFKNQDELIIAMQEYVTDQSMDCLKKAIEDCEHPDTEEALELELLKLWSDVQGLASILSMKNIEWNEDWDAPCVTAALVIAPNRQSLFLEKR